MNMVRRLILDFFILGVVALIMALGLGLPFHANAATVVDSTSEVEEPERKSRSHTALEWFLCSGRRVERQCFAQGEDQGQAQLASGKCSIKPSALFMFMLCSARDAERQPVAQEKAMERVHRRPPSERRYGYGGRFSIFFFPNFGPEHQPLTEEEIVGRDYRPITLFDLIYLSLRPNEGARLAKTESFQQKYLVRRHR